jgi:hypothetical protein
VPASGKPLELKFRSGQQVHSVHDHQLAKSSLPPLGLMSHLSDHRGSRVKRRYANREPALRWLGPQPQPTRPRLWAYATAWARSRLAVFAKMWFT